MQLQFNIGLKLQSWLVSESSAWPKETTLYLVLLLRQGAYVACGLTPDLPASSTTACSTIAIEAHLSTSATKIPVEAREESGNLVWSV